VVVEAGETDREPDFAPPVENSVPLQESELVLLQVNREESPDTIDAGFAVTFAVGALGALAENSTVQLAEIGPVL
jgi:hypothetical protein